MAMIPGLYRRAFEHRRHVINHHPQVYGSQVTLDRATRSPLPPTHQIPAGTVIDESLDIMHWALEKHDPENWLTRIDAELVGLFDSAFKHHLDRYKYAARYDADPLANRSAGLAILADLDTRLAGLTYLGGERPRFSDIAIFPFVRQFAGVDAAWFAACAPQRVREWLAILVASDLYERAMVRIEPWTGEQD